MQRRPPPMQNFKTRKRLHTLRRARANSARQSEAPFNLQSKFEILHARADGSKCLPFEAPQCFPEWRPRSPYMLQSGKFLQNQNGNFDFPRPTKGKS